MTNGDKIRSMSDEKLAERIVDISEFCQDGNCLWCKKTNHFPCYQDKKQLLKWLSSEVEE